MALEFGVGPSGAFKDNEAAGQSPIGQAGRGQSVSSRQWIRAISIQAGDGQGNEIDCSNLRVQFMVRQKDTQHPHWCYVRITNLSDQTANRGMKEFTKLTLKAGYQGRMGPIFKGQVF